MEVGKGAPYYKGVFMITKDGEHHGVRYAKTPFPSWMGAAPPGCKFTPLHGSTVAKPQEGPAWVVGTSGNLFEMVRDKKTGLFLSYDLEKPNKYYERLLKLGFVEMYKFRNQYHGCPDHYFCHMFFHPGTAAEKAQPKRKRAA